MQLAAVLLLAALGSVTWGERADAKTRVGGIDLAAVAGIRGEGFQAPERTWENSAATTNSRRDVYSLGFTGHQYDPETGLVYARARYYDPDLGRFISRDAYEGDLSDAPSLHRYAYAHDNPAAYRDEDGRSATVVGGITGFFWGFGQMVGRGIDDLAQGKVRDTSEYLGIWGQNIVAGVELGASVDVCALSGGAAASACGALGMAGFDALTVTGDGKSAGEFARGQVVEGAKGAVLGPLVAKAAPYVGKAAGAVLRQVEKIPGAQMVEKKAVQAVGNVVQAVKDRYVVTEADALVATVDEAAGSIFSRASGSRVTGPVGRGAATPEVTSPGGTPALEGTPYSPATVNARSAEFYEMYGDNPLRGTFSNMEARQHYLAEEAKIVRSLDPGASLETQARKAFDIRNFNRSRAREFMSDRVTADRLMREEPNKIWEEMLEYRKSQGLVGDDVFREIVESATKRTRTSVNKALGLE